MPGFLDGHEPELLSEQSGFVGADERQENLQDQLEIERLTESNSFGLGNLVDRIMNFNLFKVDEGQETADDDAAALPSSICETAEEARQRMEAEMKRRRDEKEKLVSRPPPAPLGENNDAPGENGGWQDAAWLLSVATKAMF